MLLLCTTSSILSSAVFYFCLRSSSQLSTATLAADHSTEYVYVLDRQQSMCIVQSTICMTFQKDTRYNYRQDISIGQDIKRRCFTSLRPR